MMFAFLAGLSKAETANRTYDLNVQEISPSTFWIEGAMAMPDEKNGGAMVNTGFVIGEHGVMVIDTGWTKKHAEAVIAEIRKRTGKPVTHVVITHPHPDHSLAAHHYIKATGARYVGHANAPQMIKDKREGQWKTAQRLIPSWIAGEEMDLTLPDTLVADEVIDLGGKKVTVRTYGDGHTNADLVVWIEDEKVLFGGDLLANQVVPGTFDANFSQWLQRLSDLEKLGADFVVPGHGPAGSADEVIGYSRKYVGTVFHNMSRAVDDGVDMQSALDAFPKETFSGAARFEHLHGNNLIRAFQEAEMALFN